MAVILCIETATTNCSVALSVDGNIRAVREENPQKYSHAEKLHMFIDEVFKICNLSLNKLDAVAVSKGPGSYTGLRIGVSAAKGIAFALDIPLISIATPEVLAQQIQNLNHGFVIPLLDARRMEVYSAIFNQDKEMVRKIEAEILTDQSFKAYLNEAKCVFIGDAVTKSKSVITHQNAVFLEDKYPSAKEMGSVAEHKFQNADFEDVAYFEPFYLKEFMPG